MKFSYNWLQSLLEKPLPPPEQLAEEITFHSSEIEEVLNFKDDTILDVKVLPDKSAWLLSHRGLAKELSVLLDNPLKNDAFLEIPKIPQGDQIKISLESETCDFYSAALIVGVEVKPSPGWLKDRLEAIGQRSINNIVDATNYVMFELGQPLHAFDADKLTKKDDKYHIAVRNAKDKEVIVTLTKESYDLSSTSTLIVDGNADVAIGIAGIKGGQVAAVDDSTKNILLEAAHFDRYAIRKTAKFLRLQTDASKRYENGIIKSVAPIALSRAIALIAEIAGGKAVSTASAGDPTVITRPIAVSIAKINSVLGLTLSNDEVLSIVKRFGYESSVTEDDILNITPPFERDDLIIPEDIIEEIGRMNGLHHIKAIPPVLGKVTEINVRHYYAEKIRHILVSLGFSEVYTSSFTNSDIVSLENALATDKGYLRSNLINNLRNVLIQNSPHRDLLGIAAVKVFEIGTVFLEDREEFRVALGVRTGTTYKSKNDDPLLEAALLQITNHLNLEISILNRVEAVIEFSLDAVVKDMPVPDTYATVEKSKSVNYKAFSPYPSISRDIAMWVPEDVTVKMVEEELVSKAGPLCVRLTHVDTFSKDGRTSLAFRLVFQSAEKTLTDTKVEECMSVLYKTVANKGWEAR